MFSSFFVYPFFYLQKDKIKIPFIRVLWEKYLLSCHSKAMPISYRHFIFTIPSSCPRDFYVSQGDKHSDLTVCTANRNTVMAVVADSHRDFLTPEHTVAQYARQRIFYIQMPCVYSFVYILYHLKFNIAIWIYSHKKLSVIIIPYF